MPISDSRAESSSPTTVATSLIVLLGRLVDYAGLFPPAGLGMAKALQNYTEYRRARESWMLGRFIVPIARLKELETALADLPQQGTDERPWRLSALLGTDANFDAAHIHAFNARHVPSTTSGGLRIESVECKVASSEEIARVAEQIPATLERYFELPLTDELPTLIAEVRRVGGRAKIRTGGETATAFPSAGQIAFFLRVCAAAKIPFKATAGLHHPLRSIHKFTYAGDSPSGTMHGFLNVFLAAAFVHSGMNAKDAEAVLAEESAEAFRFEGGGISWRDRKLSSEALQSARQLFCMSFGSCSFTEPVADLQALRLL